MCRTGYTVYFFMILGYGNNLWLDVSLGLNQGLSSLILLRNLSETGSNASSFDIGLLNHSNSFVSSILIYILSSESVTAFYLLKGSHGLCFGLKGVILRSDEQTC